jgi:hypothetical protein
MRRLASHSRENAPGHGRGDMDIYHVWCNLKPGVSDVEFVDGLRGYLERLRSDGELHSYRITRCKLGFRPAQLRDFHITLDFENLTQLQAAFDKVATRTDPIEGLHHAVNSKVQDVFFALYRDFPDDVRVRGQEQF